MIIGHSRDEAFVGVLVSLHHRVHHARIPPADPLLSPPIPVYIGIPSGDPDFGCVSFPRVSGMKPNLVAVAAGLLLQACSFGLNDPPPDPSRLALACETAKCECRPPKSGLSFFPPPSEPVQWRSDGSAGCREGLLLNRVP
jgi:hypothetical protein